MSLVQRVSSLRTSSFLPFFNPHLDMSVVQSLGKLLKLFTHSEGDGVVPEGAARFDDVLVPLLLDHLLLLQFQSNLL